MASTQLHLLDSSTLFSAAYGEGTYSCGDYEVGCSTSSTSVLPPNTSAILSEPSIVVPGSLLLAIIVALITTSIVKLIKRRTSQKK